MNSRERVYKTLRFERPDRAPRDLWVLMATDLSRTAEVDALLERFPMDITYCSAEGGWNFQKKRNADTHFFHYGPAQRAAGTPYQVGSYVDAWGARFTWPRPASSARSRSRRSPTGPRWTISRRPGRCSTARTGTTSTASATTPTGSSWPSMPRNPFERMQFLRGTEQVCSSTWPGASAEVLRLRDMVHEFFLREIELWAQDGRGRHPLHGRLGHAERAADLARRCGASSSSRCTPTTAG